MSTFKSFVGFVLVLLQLASAGVITRQSSCVSQSQPNPIVNEYPGQLTGTSNGTIAIIPIPMDIARSIIPSQYNILTKAIDEVFPVFAGSSAYPMMVQAGLDHGDVISREPVGDFSRFETLFPFVDILRDGYTSFSYIHGIVVSASNTAALAGAGLFGETVVPGNFNPPCDAYMGVGGNTSFTAWNAATGAEVGSLNFMPAKGSPYSIAALKNVTNQPLTGGQGLVCDNMITLFNSSISQGKYAPAVVEGSVTLADPLFTENTTFYDVWAYQVDVAFIENTGVTCQDLQGYSGTGSGD